MHWGLSVWRLSDWQPLEPPAVWRKATTMTATRLNGCSKGCSNLCDNQQLFMNAHSNKICNTSQFNHCLFIASMWYIFAELISNSRTPPPVLLFVANIRRRISRIAVVFWTVLCSLWNCAHDKIFVYFVPDFTIPSHIIGFVLNSYWCRWLHFAMSFFQLHIGHAQM